MVAVLVEARSKPQATKSRACFGPIAGPNAKPGDPSLPEVPDSPPVEPPRPPKELPRDQTPVHSPPPSPPADPPDPPAVA